MYTAKEKVENHKIYLKLNYRKYRDEWKDCEDDRLVFCNIYDQLMEALDAMKEVENIIIWCGFYDEFKKNTKLMDSIIARF